MPSFMGFGNRPSPVSMFGLDDLSKRRRARAHAAYLHRLSLRPVLRPHVPSATPRPGSTAPPTSSTASSILRPIPRRFEPSSTPVTLATSHGRVRIHYPVTMTDQIFRNTRMWMDVYPDCGYNFQVEALVDRAGHAPAVMDCGTFSTLERANQTVLQAFSEDSLGLMADRYTSMVFRETDEVPGSHYWSGFCLGLHHPILRLWAKQLGAWSFRVETKMVAKSAAP